MNNGLYLNKVFYKTSTHMDEIPDNTVHLVVTSPPYFNIKDYAKDGYQERIHSKKNAADLGNKPSFAAYIEELCDVWKECFRVLKPNGKLCINVPLMPMLKREMHTHYNRDILDLQASIQSSILHNTSFHLMDLYIWNRSNPSKRLMFGSYPYPRNFYAQNTCEFITIFVKDGPPNNNVTTEIREASKLTLKEWIEYTKQIWNIPIPGKNDLAFGKHSAIMPEEIVRRLVKLYTFQKDIVLDPFTGSGTTLKVAKELHRQYIGYELYEYYKQIIDLKLGESCDAP